MVLLNSFESISSRLKKKLLSTASEQEAYRWGRLSKNHVHLVDALYSMH